jgi:hypothetical protein
LALIRSILRRGGVRCVNVEIFMMQSDDNPLAELARQARSGDPVAAEDFRREMSLALEGMVRLALRKRSCFSAFEERIRTQADQLQQSNDWKLPQGELARRIAGQVCDGMIDRLQAGSRVQDTVVCAGSFGTQPTVVGSQW